MIREQRVGMPVSAAFDSHRGVDRTTDRTQNATHKAVRFRPVFVPTPHRAPRR